jgi:tetratricopeptide (TPR) repeat protein
MEFLETALKRLQAELNREIKPEPRLPERQQQLVEALEEAVSKTGKKVLFLVDGLNEIYRLEREFLNVLFMTMTVKDRIVWVCAGQSEGALEEALKSRGAVWVFPEGLPPLDEQAIRAMLIEHLGRLKYALFERDEGERNRFVEAVTRKSEGLPLYVRMVIEDLKAGRLTVQDEEKLPEGLVAYYERLLERLRVSDVGTVLTPLFCLLAWAKEHITEGTMKVLLQTHHLADTPRWSELFQRALEHGHLMLQQRPTSDDETGWAIYHDSFRQYLLESGTVSVSREWAQERWLEVCKDWKALASQEPSLHRYILRHYADHLYEKCPMTNERMTNEQMTNYAELCQLALDPEFAHAQTKHLPDEPNLPLKTVQRALDAAIQLEDAPMMARLLMEHAKRAQSEETPLQAWRKGHRERALELATDIVFKRNHKLGTLWSLLLAWVAESEGEREWSKRCLDETRKRWEGAKLAELGGWQGEMAVFLLGEIGQVEGVIEVVGLVLDDEFKRELATSWASKGLFDRALKLAEGIECAKWRVNALSAIAEGMAKAGMFERAKEIFDQALEATEKMEDAKERSRALSVIAEEMAKATVQEVTLWQQVLKVAEGIEEAKWRAEALSAIAVGMTKAGMFDQALKVAEGIEEADVRAWALREIAEGMAKAGMFDQALKVAEGIEKACWRSMVLMTIAVRTAKAGMVERAKEVFDQALKLAEGIEGAWEQAEALGTIAEGMARAGMIEQAKEIFEHALKVAEGIEEAWWRAGALREIAVMIAKAEMREWAKAVLDQALKVAKGIKDAMRRSGELAWIAIVMARMAMFDQALKVAERVEEAFSQAEVLWAIAEAMAKAGLFEQALQVAKEIELTGYQMVSLEAIAKAMTKAGMEEQARKVFERALQVAEEIKEEQWWAEMLRMIVEGMAKAGMFDQALQVAEGIKWAWERARALRAIVEGMAKAVVQNEALWQQALKMAERIEWTEERAKALVTIAKGIAEVGMVGQAKEVFGEALQVAEGIGDKGKQAKALGVIAEGMAEVGMTEQAKEIFGRALQVAEEIEDKREQGWTLRAIAKTMAKVGMTEQAKEIFERALQMEEEIGWRYLSVDELFGESMEAKSEKTAVEQMMAVRTEGLPSVLEVLAGRASEGDGKSKEGFLRLLPLCGWSLEFAYKACGLMAWLYPERGEEIAGVIAATGD